MTQTKSSNTSTILDFYIRHNQQFIKSQLIPITFPKIVTKTVYTRKRIKHFRFHMNPQNTFCYELPIHFVLFSSNFDPNSKQFISCKCERYPDVIDTRNRPIPPANLSLSVSKCGILYPTI